MQSFLQRHQSEVVGVLSGFDRVLFRGTLRSISYAEGLDRFLGALRLKYKDFAAFAQDCSQRLKDHAQSMAQKAGRPFIYLSSGSRSKEQIARDIAARDHIEQGLVCVLRCVEPCMSFSIRKADKGAFRFVAQERKCLHLYFYFVDREFGLMHVRLATWLPFGIQVCLNGRDYLARRMQRAGIGFEQRDNCFVAIDDLPKAQAMMDQLIDRKWQRLLDALAKRVNPLPRALNLFGYYWSIRESEIATDVMFKDAAALARIYPSLVDHAVKSFSSGDVLRFLGRRICASRFNGEVSTSLLQRSEGIRVKHRAEENSIKMYNKQGSVLRIETTINNVRRFRVRRMTTWKNVRRMRWIPMRCGLADLVRRVQISRAANERYLQALAFVQVPAPVATLLDPVTTRVIKDGRPYRALQPVSREEAQVFQLVLDGRFLLRGFTNRDLRQALWPKPKDPIESRRQSGKATRLLRLLRAHRLIRKVSNTRYYRVTDRGQKAMSTSLILRAADVTKIAA
jgi:hypothetical protein